MSNYVGLQGQISKNNRLSVILLIAFPFLILFLVWAFFFLINYFQSPETENLETANEFFLRSAPFVVGAVALWFFIAFFAHTSIIKKATRAKTLERKTNKRVYNLVENLCISRGMKMPKLQIIDDPGLNAFASGINEKTYSVTLTRGLIETLDDEELEGVIAHELMHIRNKDVRLMIIAIVFVGILAFLAQVIMRMLIFSPRRRSSKNNNQLVLIIALVLAFVGYLTSVLFRFALSRKREYMADAGAAEMTKKPWALASALRKVSGNHKVSTVNSDEIAELFIENSVDKEEKKSLKGFMHNLFASHPPIEKRIAFLEQV